jgi:hypothetical protein
MINAVKELVEAAEHAANRLDELTDYQSHSARRLRAAVAEVRAEEKPRVGDRALLMYYDRGLGHGSYGVSLDGELICQGMAIGDTAQFIVDALNAYKPGQPASAPIHQIGGKP